MLSDCLQRLDIGLPRSHGPADLRTAMTVCHTPGASIALIDGGTVAETACAGVRETGGTDPVTERTLFQSGSISKSVAAACALRLVADGVLDLDEDVNERLRSWRIPANDGWQPRVCMRQLLAHTAGTTVGGFIGYPQGTPVPSVPDLLDGRGNSEPVVVSGLPGIRFRYSGGGYVVMQQLLADVTGQDFPALAAELVLGPLGMRDSMFAQPLPPELASMAATGHHPGPVAVPGRWHTYPELAAAGLWSTPIDLARFFLALRDSLAGVPGSLLPQHIAAQMVIPGVPGASYGLGLTLAAEGEPASIGHGGNDQGFENHAVLYPDTGQGIVMMTNSYHGSTLIHSVVVPAVAKAYGWPTRPNPPAAPTSPTPGRYGAFAVELSNEDVLLTLPGQQPVRLRPGDGGRWLGRQVNVDIWFDAGALVVEQDGVSTRAELD